MHFINEACKPNARCHNFRICTICARIRQAHFADVAQALLGHENALYFTRYTPEINTEQEITRIKAAFKRQLGHHNAVWSVEQGTQQSLLHLNLISPVTPARPIKNSLQWASEKITDLRRTAAYILKPEQVPSKTSYNGRQFGTMQSMSEILAEQSRYPIIDAAVIETLVLKDYVLTPIPAGKDQITTNQPQSQSHYHAIALRHLAKLHHFSAQIKGR